MATLHQLLARFKDDFAHSKKVKNVPSGLYTLDQSVDMLTGIYKTYKEPITISLIFLPHEEKRSGDGHLSMGP